MLLGKKKLLDDGVLNLIYKKDRLKRWTTFILGILITALAYNIFLLPAKVVYGIGGVGVIFNSAFNIDPSIVILIGSIFLLILSYIFLGKEESRHTIVGTLLYPVFVKLTAEFAKLIDLSGTDQLLIIVFGAVITGFGLGLIFKSGFTTGGTDILNQIVAKYCKTSMGNAMIVTDGLIILTGLTVFGWTKLMYSIISLYIISVMTDKVILGISQSKAFYIITNKEKEVQTFILEHLSHGVTVLDGKGGFTGRNQKVIMCIIPTKEYYIAKEGISEIDPHAFFVVTDAYEVQGGA